MKNNKRTVPPVGKLITDLRKNKGWSIEQLAHEAGVNEKTIRNAENDVATFPETLRLIADALDSDVSTLRGLNPVPAKLEPLTIVVRFEISHASLVGTEATTRLATALAQIAKAVQAIVPVTVEAGSIILTCLIEPSDLIRLIAAFGEGLLEENLHVSEIAFLDGVLKPAANLTMFERELLKLMQADEYSPADIAQMMSISLSDIARHQRRVTQYLIEQHLAKNLTETTPEERRRADDFPSSEDDEPEQ